MDLVAFLFFLVLFHGTFPIASADHSSATVGSTVRNLVQKRFSSSSSKAKSSVEENERLKSLVEEQGETISALTAVIDSQAQEIRSLELALNLSIAMRDHFQQKLLALYSDQDDDQDDQDDDDDDDDQDDDYADDSISKDKEDGDAKSLEEIVSRRLSVHDLRKKFDTRR